MKISLITISYNSQKTIKDTFESVQKQSFKNFEHILIDGGSTDQTLAIANQYPHLSKIISEPDNGIYEALNKGIVNASGEVVGFLNSDDVFYDKNSLSIIEKAFDENTDCVFGDLVYTDHNEKIKRIWKGSTYKSGGFKKGWMPAHPTFYCRKKLYDQYGLYDESLKIAGDFELMLRFFEKYKIKSKYIPKILVNMKIGGVSNRSLKNKVQILREEFGAFKKNKIPVNKLSYIYSKAKKIKEFKFR